MAITSSIQRRHPYYHLYDEVYQKLHYSRL
nr:MAG TPA: hypothetical protein [Caudoviricetes sp.]